MIRDRVGVPVTDEESEPFGERLDRWNSTNYDPVKAFVCRVKAKRL